MNCRDTERIVIDVVVGEAEPRNRSLLQAHLEGCPRCQERYAPMLETSSAVEGIGMRDLPAGFDQRYASRLAARRRTAGLPARFRWLTAILGSDLRFAMALVVGTLLALFGRLLSIDAGRPSWAAPEWNLLATLVTFLVLTGFTHAVKQSLHLGVLFSRRRYEE